MKTILILTVLIALIGFASERDYQECVKNNQSVALCGGGNTR